MMIVNLLILALLGAWLLQIALAVGAAAYLVVRSLSRDGHATTVLRTGTA